MKLRALMIVLLLALLLLVPAVTSAQDACLGLSAEDCEAIAAATTASASATAFYQNFSIDFSVTGVPDGGDVTFNLVGEGPVALGSSAMIPLNFAAVMDVSFAGGGQDGAATVEARLIDGILYAFDPTTNTWGGVDLAAALANPQALGLPPELLALANPEAAGGQMAALGPALESFGALATVPGFLTYSRAGDTFTFRADLTAALQSAEFSEAATNMQAALANDPQFAQFGALLPVLPMLLSEGEIVVVQVVDPALGAVTDLTFEARGAINAGLMGMTGSDGQAAPPITIELVFNVKLSEINGTFTFEVPADVQMAQPGS